jgi:hypothetical protein
MKNGKISATIGRRTGRQAGIAAVAQVFVPVARSMRDGASFAKTWKPGGPWLGVQQDAASCKHPLIYLL